MVASLWFAALGGLSLAGAGWDIIHRRLPNVLCLALLIAGLALAFAGGGWTAVGWHAAHSVLALAIGFALFAAGMVGGGDGKFYAGTAAFFPVSAALPLGVAITLSGLAVAIVWFIARRIMKKPIRPKDGSGKLPYGVAITAGALVCAALLPG